MIRQRATTPVISVTHPVRHVGRETEGQSVLGELAVAAIERSQDFQSCTNAVGLRGELEAGDDPVEMVKTLQQQC